MNKETTSIRLKKIMQENNLKQVDILRLSAPFCEKYNVKMNKSDISQYVSGKVEPSQDKLVVLAMALDVTEAWLMGFDVPHERKNSAAKAHEDFEWFYKFSLLNKRDKQVVMNLINSLLTDNGAQ